MKCIFLVKRLISWNRYSVRIIQSISSIIHQLINRHHKRFAKRLIFWNNTVLNIQPVTLFSNKAGSKGLISTSSMELSVPQPFIVRSDSQSNRISFGVLLMLCCAQEYSGAVICESRRSGHVQNFTESQDFASAIRSEWRGVFIYMHLWFSLPPAHTAYLA